MFSKIKKYLMFRARKACYVGFLDEKDLRLPSDERFDKICWLELGDYKEGWFADPFFLKHEDNHIQLLVEEYVYKVSKGRISLLDVDVKDGRYILSKITPVLDTDTHLSYPAIYRQGDDIYVYPENYQGGSLKIYKFNSEKNELNFAGVLIDKPLVDTSIFKVDNMYYAFGTLNEGDPMDATKCCEVYVSESLLGPYSHLQTIKNNRREERGAGDIFINQNGELIRPAQNNQVSYGKSLVMYKLEFDDKGFVTETLLNRYEPDYSKKYGMFLHTFNLSKGLCVIDGYDYVHPVYAKCYEYIHTKWVHYKYKK